VFVLEKLTDEQIETILKQALGRLEPIPSSQTPNQIPSTPPSLSNSTAASPNPDDKPMAPNEDSLWPSNPQATPKILASISSLAAGDARTALSLLELVLGAPPTIGEDKLLESLKRSVSSRYDRSGDDRYDMISAMHKSIRGSDGSAAMYWLARFDILARWRIYRVLMCV
jgi:putative ATPase